MTSRTPKALKDNNYRETIPCKWCKYAKAQEYACGTQSFINIIVCKKADGEQVSSTGTCDKAKR